MNDRNWEEILDRSLSGNPPGQVYRARVLLDSTAALSRRRQVAERWRMAGLSAAAVLIAALSFLLGRGTSPRHTPGPTPGPVAAEAGETVGVSPELLAWLEAAQLFRQLGMEDRMARAVERASRLLPRDKAITSDEAAKPVFLAGHGIPDGRSESPGLCETPDSHESFDIVNRIMARSSGGYTYADETD